MSIIDARGLDPAEFWAADACIVGAGAAGTSLAEALAAVRTVLEEEEGEPLVDDLLFTNLITQ